jgi:hypothetical protein
VYYNLMRLANPWCNHAMPTTLDEARAMDHRHRHNSSAGMPSKRAGQLPAFVLYQVTFSELKYRICI